MHCQTGTFLEKVFQNVCAAVSNGDAFLLRYLIKIFLLVKYSKFWCKCNDVRIGLMNYLSYNIFQKDSFQDVSK